MIKWWVARNWHHPPNKELAMDHLLAYLQEQYRGRHIMDEEDGEMWTVQAITAHRAGLKFVLSEQRIVKLPWARALTPYLDAILIADPNDEEGWE